MVRNRLEELHNASKHPPATEAEEMKPLKQAAKKRSQAEARAALESEQFLQRLQDVSKKVDQIHKNGEELRAVQRTMLTATHKDEAKERRADDLAEENKKLASSIRNTLKAEKATLETMQTTSPKKLTDQQRLDLRLRKTQVTAQSKRFYEAWNEYNQGQLEFRDKSKKLLVKRCKITNSNYSDDQIETMLDEGNTAVFAKSILDEERLARQQLSELQDRHDEFLKLEKSIKEVHDMFVEIAGLVEEQGEIMDNIARHVEEARDDVEKGKGHLNQAKQNQAKARKKKICLFSVLAVVVFIVIIVVLAEFGAFSGSSETEVRIVEKVVYVTESTTTSTTTTTTAESVVIGDGSGDGPTPAP